MPNEDCDCIQEPHDVTETAGDHVYVEGIGVRRSIQMHDGAGDDWMTPEMRLLVQEYENRNILFLLGLKTIQREIDRDLAGWGLELRKGLDGGEDVADERD